MKIEIFGKEECPLCREAKELIGKKMGQEYRYWDLENPEGLAEYCFHDYPARFKMKYPVVSVGGESFHNVGEAVKCIKNQLKK